MARLVLTRCALAATAVVEVQNLKSMKRTELPIYAPETNIKDKSEVGKKDDKNKQTEERESFLLQKLEESVGVVRKGAQSVIGELYKVKDKGSEIIKKGQDDVDWAIKYLGAPDNTTPKAPAIALGGLTGFILALRGGIIRKVVFTTAGALTMVAICYPEEFSEKKKEFTSQGVVYGLQGYHALFGDKDSDPNKLPSLPKLPTSTSEVWDSISNMWSSKSTIPIADKDTPPPTLVSKVVPLVDSPHIVPGDIIADKHKEAIEKNCHCPIGACLGPHDPEEPATLPYPPPVPNRNIFCPPCPAEGDNKTTVESTAPKGKDDKTSKEKDSEGGDAKGKGADPKAADKKRHVTADKSKDAKAADERKDVKEDPKKRKKPKNKFYPAMPEEEKEKICKPEADKRKKIYEQEDKAAKEKKEKEIKAREKKIQEERDKKKKEREQKIKEEKEEAKKEAEKAAKEAEKAKKDAEKAKGH